MAYVYFEVYMDAGCEFRWRMKTRNGRIIGVSGEGYKRRHGAKAAARRVWQLLNSSPPDYREA